MNDLANTSGNVAQLENTLRVLGLRYQNAREAKKDAAADLREAKKAARESQPEYFQALDDMLQSAKEKAQERMRQSNSYVAAETAKQQAAQDLRDVLKEAKARGLDVRAFKTALKLGELDTFERTDHFDAIDIYAKALGLWNQVEI